MMEDRWVAAWIVHSTAKNSSRRIAMSKSQKLFKVRKQYQQMACHGLRCTAMTRMYCACDKAVPLCHMCYALHLRDAAR
jgi:hypothetical protein